jgi:hypothetical protein
MPNITTVELHKTANTCLGAAEIRAQLVAGLGVKKALELCVGPSNQVMKDAYRRYGIDCIGNDIDSRWNPDILGDCLEIDYQGRYVIFAPPLSRGCSGTREDSLSPMQVQPGFINFINTARARKLNRAMMVMPARSLSTRQDRTELHKILNHAHKMGYGTDIVECLVGVRQIRKYTYCMLG